MAERAESAQRGTEELRSRLPAREPFTILPTPLVFAGRLSAHLGQEVWIKRDDLCGPALGGNKFRKLEYLVADALAHGADTLVSVGALQSNHARSVAAVAAACGLRCELVLGGEQPDRAVGNLLLSEMLGASMRFAATDDWAALDAAGQARADELTAQGARPYVIPVGGSVGLGVAAFAAAYWELRDQCAAHGLVPSAVVHASSSGGTQAGLELGRALVGDDVVVCGVDVATMQLQERVPALVAAGARVLGVAPPRLVPTVVDGYLGDGYAVPTSGAAAAQRLLLRTEGVLTDPVYSAKAAHALCDRRWDGPVVFWHTGGAPAVFAGQG